nr:MAG TPA: hypothetical protein [Caudoviricetes sp.]
MTRGQRLYNKTHTLPIREGFFLFSVLIDILKIVRCNLNRMTMFF